MTKRLPRGDGTLTGIFWVVVDVDNNDQLLDAVNFTTTKKLYTQKRFAIRAATMASDQGGNYDAIEVRLAVVER